MPKITKETALVCLEQVIGSETTHPNLLKKLKAAVGTSTTSDLTLTLQKFKQEQIDTGTLEVQAEFERWCWLLADTEQYSQYPQPGHPALQPPENGQDYLTQRMPKELMTYLFSSLRKEDVARLSRVNKTLQKQVQLFKSTSQYSALPMACHYGLPPHPIASLQGHTGSVNTVLALLSGELISGSNDKTLKVWRLREGKYHCVQTLAGHTNTVGTVLALPSGELISGSTDETLKVWRLKEGKYHCVQTLVRHNDWVYTVLVLPSGELISGSSDKTLKIWRFPSLEAKFRPLTTTVKDELIMDENTTINRVNKRQRIR